MTENEFNLDKIFNYKHDVVKNNLVDFLNCFKNDDLILMNISMFKFTFVKFFDISATMVDIVNYLNLLKETLSKELGGNINYIIFKENDKNKKIIKFEIEVGDYNKLNSCLSFFDINKRIG